MTTRPKAFRDDPLMLHIGRAIRRRRRILDMTQSDLAAAIPNCRFQMIQKYETATCRIPVDRLWHIAQALHVTPDHFFQGYRPKCQPSQKSNPPSKPSLRLRQALERQACYGLSQTSDTSSRSTTPTEEPESSQAPSKGT